MASNLENGTTEIAPEEQAFTKSLRPIIGTCLAISALAAMALTSTTGVSPSAPMASSTQLEVVKQGKQPIQAGCANIYGSDPDQVFIDPDTGLRVLTAVFTICDDRSLNGVALNALGFDHQNDIDIGLTYVETGPGCWLTLYDGPNFNGKTAVISPQTSMHLKHVGARNWNDLTRSLTTRSSTGDGVALYLSHRVALGSVNDHCIAMYNANPETYPKADGLYLCGDRHEATKWNFDMMDIIEQGFNIDGTHFGIKYIMSGRKVKVEVFDGATRNTVSHGPLEMSPHETLDMSSVTYGDDDTWENKAKSFTLTELA
jgi:hypothetical protein